MSINTRKNIYIITVMVICIIVSFNTELTKGDDMPKGYPDWSVNTALNIASQTYDVSNPNIYGFSDFSGGGGKSIINMGGQHIFDNFEFLFSDGNGIKDVSRKYYYIHPTSLSILPGQTDPYDVHIVKFLPIIVSDTFGLNVVMSRHATNEKIDIDVSFFYPTHSVHFFTEHRLNDNAIGVIDASNEFIQTHDNTLNTLSSVQVWNYYKIVGSLANNKYSHVIYNGRLVDATDVAKGIDEANTGQYYMRIRIKVTNEGTTSNLNYINGIVFSVDEPSLVQE